MKLNLSGLAAGTVFGIVLSWARLSDPGVIRNMLLLREAHVFLIMGSAIVVAFIGVRVLRSAGVRAVLTGEPIGWSVQQPERRHLIGSVIFGAGWSVAGTCPGPVAAMIGEGNLVGLTIVAGLVAGAAFQPSLVRQSRGERRETAAPQPVGL